MQTFHCKIETDLGILFLSLSSRYKRNPYCGIVFVPANPSPSVRMEYKNSNIFFLSSWEKSTLEFYELCELVRIIEETLKWTKYWNILTGLDVDLYESYLDGEIAKE